MPPYTVSHFSGAPVGQGEGRATLGSDGFGVAICHTPPLLTNHGKPCPPLTPRPPDRNPAPHQPLPIKNQTASRRVNSLVGGFTRKYNNLDAPACVGLSCVTHERDLTTHVDPKKLSTMVVAWAGREDGGAYVASYAKSLGAARCHWDACRRPGKEERKGGGGGIVNDKNVRWVPWFGS